MTWPFENDTGAIVKKLAKRSLVSEKRRNLMVVVAVALAAFLVCLSAVISVSIAQIQQGQVADTYEAVFTGVEASDVAALTVFLLGLPLSMAVCAEVSKKSFAGAVVPYQFPFLQMGLFLLVLFGMEVVLSVWMVRRQKKQSLVEQMRATG